MRRRLGCDNAFAVRPLEQRARQDSLCRCFNVGDLRELAVSLRHADARLLAVFNLQKVSIRQYHHLQLLRN